jgi:outer membrane protein OmpA-like peptidoglycan-associated protein
VPDKDDRCPEIPGIQELRGCPDRDGDGLQDNLDNCPDEYGPIENIGCPETEVQEKHILAVYIENILFDEAKWVLNDDAQNMLDQAAKYLLNNPNIRIRIIGHTNKVGKEGYNMKLSKRRVKAVRKYLVNEDVNEDRIEIDWKGESAPLNEPDLEKARIKNRRVEVKILNE